MKIEITSEPKEIAALVDALQERQISKNTFVPETADGVCLGGTSSKTSPLDN